MPELPKWFEEKLNAKFGYSLNGYPKLKVVFAPYVRDFRGNHKYINPLTNRTFECWVLTRRVNPSFFGDPADWEKDRWFNDDVSQRKVDTKGEYPHEGDYIFICPLSNDGEFLPLTESVFHAICAKVKVDEEFAEKTAAERLEQMQQSDAEKQTAADKRSKEIEGERDEYYRSNWDRINKGATRGYSITPR